MIRLSSLLAVVLAVGCQSAPPNPHIEQTKAQVYEAMGELIVREIQNSTLPAPEVRRQSSPPRQSPKEPVSEIAPSESMGPVIPPPVFPNPFSSEGADGIPVAGIEGKSYLPTRLNIANR